MKKCLKCGCSFEPSKGFVNFCSIKCRNSRVFSEASKEKKSKKTKESWNKGVYKDSRLLIDYGVVKKKIKERTFKRNKGSCK